MKKVRANLLFTLSWIFVWLPGVVDEVANELCGLPVVLGVKVHVVLQIKFRAIFLVVLSGVGFISSQ